MKTKRPLTIAETRAYECLRHLATRTALMASRHSRIAYAETNQEVADAHLSMSKGLNELRNDIVRMINTFDELTTEDSHEN